MCVCVLRQGPVAWGLERAVLVMNQVGDRDDHRDNFNQCIPLGKKDR